MLGWILALQTTSQDKLQMALMEVVESNNSFFFFCIFCGIWRKADRKSALAATLNVINRWLLDRRICMAVSGEGRLETEK